MVKFEEKKTQVLTNIMYVKDIQVGDTMYGALDYDSDWDSRNSSLVRDNDDEVWAYLNAIVYPVVSDKYRVAFTKLPLNDGFAVTIYGEVASYHLSYKLIVPNGTPLPTRVDAKIYIEKRDIEKVKTLTKEPWPEETKKIEKDTKKRKRKETTDACLGALTLALALIGAGTILYVLVIVTKVTS
jgi:hypothetical protein